MTKLIIPKENIINNIPKPIIIIPVKSLIHFLPDCFIFLIFLVLAPKYTNNKIIIKGSTNIRLYNIKYPAMAKFNPILDNNVVMAK